MKMDIEQLQVFVKDFYGYKLHDMTQKAEYGDQILFGILYDAIVFKCILGERYKEFGATIMLPSGRTVRNFFGHEASLNNDEKSIRERLQVIDDYCQLLLPDKYLEAYDKAYKKKGLFK